MHDSELCHWNCANLALILRYGRYEHPLLVNEKEKGDWVRPITAFAPPSRSHAANMKSVNLSLGSLWVRALEG